MNENIISLLEHSGIKGQKWGRRRYQNADMTWTDEGKIRYGRDAQRRRGAVKSKRKPKFSEDRHKNRSELGKFIGKVAVDTFVPGMQLRLPSDIHRVGKAIAGKHNANKYQKQRDTRPIDSESGLHVKTKYMTRKQDLKRVNPEYNDFNSNTKQNCVLCTMTYEMRRRGYDVTANRGDNYNSNDVRKMFPGYVSDVVAKRNSESRDEKFAQKILDSVTKSNPNGARGELAIYWLDGTGHSMAYEIVNGKLNLYDGQTGKVVSNPTEALANCRMATTGRLDNLDFDVDGIKEACR